LTAGYPGDSGKEKLRARKSKDQKEPTFELLKGEGEQRLHVTKGLRTPRRALHRPYQGLTEGGMRLNPRGFAALHQNSVIKCEEERGLMRFPKDSRDGLAMARFDKQDHVFTNNDNGQQERGSMKNK